jgi:hypothetical protein
VKNAMKKLWGKRNPETEWKEQEAVGKDFKS